MFLFVSLFFLIDLLELISFDELDIFDDESDENGSGCRSPGTFAFSFCFVKSSSSVDEYVGCVRGVGSGVFFLTGIDSIGDVVPLDVFIPRGVESKCGQLIELFWRPKS